MAHLHKYNCCSWNILDFGDFMTCMIWAKIQNILNGIFREIRQNSGINDMAMVIVGLNRSGGVVFRSIYMSG